MDNVRYFIIRPVLIFFVVGLFILSPLTTKNMTAENNAITMSNGWVTIHSQDRSILSLLEEMVHELDIELFLVIKPEDKQVTLNVKNISVPEAISRVLNGYDYAVVYPNPKRTKISRLLVMVPIRPNKDTADVPFDDPILNFDENFWQTFTPHKYLGGYNIIFMPFGYSKQKEREKELTAEAFIRAYEDRIQMIQEELNEDYAEKEYTRWVLARAKAELDFYKQQLEGMAETMSDE